jgi:DNA invertase Pin-like site-specific DNA recombinase
MVTILASIAQQESASISQNVRMGINFGFQEGRGRVNFPIERQIDTTQRLPLAGCKKCTHLGASLNS